MSYLSALVDPITSEVRLRDCVAITLKCKFVILNEVKNLIKPMSYKTEILRL
jgi:hypothetical protein